MKKRTFVLNNEPERASAVSFLRSAPLDRSLKVTIETVKAKRTLNQNSLYWKWISEAAEALADETGHTPDDIHEIFKRKFLSPKVVEFNSETYLRWTTTDKNITEMSNYMNHIYAFVVGELGIPLTIPPVTDRDGMEITPYGVG